MKAEYIQHLGDDLVVVNAARVSFNKESSWFEQNDDPLTRLLEQKDKKLINYLAKHNHFTPFTHCVITMRETVPLFVARQRFKHTVGFSYNEQSGRYVNRGHEFYIPEKWYKQATDKKQGASKEEIKWLSYPDIDDNGKEYSINISIKESYEYFIKDAENLYNKMIEDGIAAEQARMVLPQSMYTSYYVTGSLAAWARAYKLRSQPDAQLEIQQLAKQWDEIISPLFPVSWKALTA